MSALEIPGFLIGLAGLFSSCVDAFGYFKLAQHADKDVEVVLLKLDIEKTRLLIWGENAGLFTASRQNPWFRDERIVNLIRDILTQVERLLTDSENLRASYGARSLDKPFERAVDYISRKSLDAFRISASRFWTRNLSRLTAAPRGSRMASIKWAIYEKEKFEGLVHHLADFVDSLYELVRVDREIQDRTIIEDIESIVDIQHLAIIEEATESAYQAYSQAAASARASSEAGTADRRTLEELLKDTEGTGGTHSGAARQTSNSVELDSLLSEVRSCAIYVALTSQCRKLQTRDPCDVRDLGPQVANNLRYPGPAQWDISSKNKNGGNTLWQLIDRLIDMRKQLEDVEDETLGEVLKEEDGRLTDVQRAYMRHRLPLLNLFIYCAPCVCLVHTALSLANHLSSPFLEVRIRPDDRLVSSCCARVDRTLGLRSTLEQVRKWEAEAADFQRNLLASFLDGIWLDRRLDHLNYERAYSYEEGKTAGPTKRVLVIGEADYLAALVQRAPGRIPIAMDIWSCDFRPYFGTTRFLFGRFIESRFSCSPLASQAPISGSLTPNNTVIPHQVQRDLPGVKRSPSSLSSDAKRQRSDTGSVGCPGSRSVPSVASEDEDMEENLHAA